MPRALLIASALALQLVAPWTSAEDSRSEVAYRVIFTTALDKEDDPVSNLKEIPITAERIYFYVKLFNLENGKDYGYECRIYDGDEQLLLARNNQFTAEGGGWNFWCYVGPDPRTDRPGTWRFEGFLDGELLIEAELGVPPP